MLKKLILVAWTAGVWAQSGYVQFKRMAEPKERAFTVLAPADWRVSGGIVRVNPSAAGGTLNAIGAKLDFTMTSGDGRVTLRWLPETMYMDARQMAAGQMFPQGSNYNGALVWPKLNAEAYIQQGMLKRLRAGAQGIKVKARYPLPQVAASYAQMARSMGVPVELRYDAALMVMEYTEGGQTWEEAFYTAVQDFGQAGAGLWSNKDSFAARAPAGQLDKVRPVLTVILNSVELSPEWMMGELQGQMTRGEIARRSQQELARIDREIVEHRRRTNSEINNMMYHNLMGTDEYVNPKTQKVEIGTNAYKNRWVNERGEAIYTDDDNFDPVRAGLSGYVRSQVRKRFPEK
ncbi:MAG: hypothetical protein HY821_25670 [Acidobacteria bacterium]|nr:hypothetical protein [Acidobacteriota bacterium]